MKQTNFACLLLSITLTASETIRSKYPVQLYGFIRMEGSYDNTQIAQGDWLLYARPGDTEFADQSVITAGARGSRLGLKINGPKVFQKANVHGLFEVDFAGGFPNSSTASRQPILRLRHAWVEINDPGWELRFGQDWALISGPFPNTTSFVVGAGMGNLWMRFPQIKYTLKKDPVKLAISVNRPIAGNVKYEDYTGGDFDPVGDGELSGLPWVMGRGWLNLVGATLSLSGHYGQEQIADMGGMGHDKITYSVSADIALKTGPVKWTLRGFSGENLNSFFGGIFQGFSCDSSSVTNVASRGGWGQVQISLNSNWALTLGGGIDDPDDSDLTGDMRTKNSWLFGNVSYTPTESLLFMLETESLKTGYLSSHSGKNLRVQFITYFKF